MNIPGPQLKPALVDNEVMLGFLKAEFRDLDYRGPILDTIIADNHTLEGSILMHNFMDEAAAVFFKGLDLPRLRRYIASMYLNMR